MATQCETMMVGAVHKMIQQTIAHLENNDMLKVSKEEALALFDIVKQKGKSGRPAVVLDEAQLRAKAEEKSALKAQKAELA